MMDDFSDLLRLTEKELPFAAGVIARAFQDYPLMAYFIPEETERKKKQPRIFKSLIRQGTKYGEVYATSPDMEGVAVWFMSGKHHESLWKKIAGRLFVIPFIVGMDTFKRQRAFGAYATSVRKRVVPFPHWYLQLLGVDPRYQGQGFSSRLLQPMLSRADKEGMPCFLETHNEKNVPLYEHFRFRVVEAGLVPGSNVKSWAMLRKNEQSTNSP